MKRWIIIFAIITLAILLIVGYLYDQGYLDNLKWQWLTVLAAAIAGPYKFIAKKLRGDDITSIKESEEKYQGIKQEEQARREEIYKKLEEKDQQIQVLNDDLEEMYQELQRLKRQRRSAREEVEAMDTDEKLKEFDNEF